MKTVKDIVIDLMISTVPEARDEILSLWEVYDPAVELEKNAKQVTLKASRHRIAFDAKTMEVFWLLGYSGWQAIECYSPHIVLSEIQNIKISKLLDDDPDLHNYERLYKERLAAAQSFIEENDISKVHWPPDILLPNSDRDLSEDPQYKVAFDLTITAVGFTLLHEFYHVVLDRDEIRPVDRREEELQCDIWARNFMTKGLFQYAKSHNFSYEEVLRRRSMGLSLAALIIHEITPSFDHGGNTDYFSVATRLKTLLENTQLPDDDYFWVFTASLLIGVCRQKHITINAPPMSPKLITKHLLDLL